MPKWSYSMGDTHGAAAFPLIASGMVYTTNHNSTVAVDSLTGKIVWDVQSPNVSAETGYSMTGAPLVADGTVITGAAGAEFGIRGFLEG